MATPEPTSVFLVFCERNQDWFAETILEEATGMRCLVEGCKCGCCLCECSIVERKLDGAA